MTVLPSLTDTDAGIPDLIRRLTDDSKRLVTNEVHLARLEAKDSVKRATKGVLWLALAFGAAVVMLTAVTVCLVTLIGRLADGHMWVGALVTGVLELMLGAYLLERGVAVFAEPSYTLEETRHALKDATAWATPAR